MITYGSVEKVLVKNGGYSYKPEEQREVICSECGTTIGRQTKFNGNFEYDNWELEYYTYCPYCGEKL